MNDFDDPGGILGESVKRHSRRSIREKGSSRQSDTGGLCLDGDCGTRSNNGSGMGSISLVRCSYCPRGLVRYVSNDQDGS